VPFWLHGFLPPPATRARFFVCAVAWRALARPAMNAWKSVAARDAPFRKAAGRAIDPDDEPSAAMSGASPSGAVGSGRAATFSRLGWSWRACARGRAGSARRATRVTGRATTRLVGAVAFAAVFFAGAAFAGALFPAAAFGAAPVRFAPAVAAVGFFAAVFFGSSVFAIRPSSPSRPRSAGQGPRRKG
jgi:hypothetical protein